MSTGKRPSYKKLYEEALERIEALEHKMATSEALEEASVEDLVIALQSKQAYGDSIEDLAHIARDHVLEGLTQQQLMAMAEDCGAICFRDEEHLEDHIDDLGLYGSGNVIKELEYALTAQSESERQDCIDKALYIVKWREY